MVKKYWSFVAVALITIAIGYKIMAPVLYNNSVVQDDFRQCFFWGWSLFDKELFINDFFTEMYQSLFVKTPLLYLVFKIAPYLTDNLILYSKILVIILSLTTGFTAFIFFQSLLKKYNWFQNASVLNDLLALGFTACVIVLSWCTDHITAAHARSFIWLALLLYMHFKLNNQNTKAAWLTFLLLMLSPISFLLCFTMEAFDLVINQRNKFFKTPTLIGLITNGLITAFMYLYLFKDIHTQGVGTPFTVKELKQLAEFNPGGRHPIFGSSIWDGTWWFNEHWGMGVGALPISQIIPIALTIIIIYFIYLFLTHKLQPSITSITKSTTGTLFHASISLYFASQFLFPTLYLPSRYIAAPWLLLSVIILYLSIIITSNNLAQYLFKSKPLIQRVITAIIAILFCLCFWGYFKKYYYTRFVSIDPTVMRILSETPKNSLIAGHPLLPDLNVASITSKRKVFIDYERSMAYTKESLNEIRRRNVVALTMTYAKSQAEFIELAKANGITHFMVHQIFYSEKYLAHPSYLEPYNETLRGLVQSNNGFFLDDILKKMGQPYIILDITKLDDLS